MFFSALGYWLPANPLKADFKYRRHVGDRG